jgi:hypothetical protein
MWIAESKLLVFHEYVCMHACMRVDKVMKHWFVSALCFVTAGTIAYLVDNYMRGRLDSYITLQYLADSNDRATTLRDAAADNVRNYFVALSGINGQNGKHRAVEAHPTRNRYSALA